MSTNIEWLIEDLRKREAKEREHYRRVAAIAAMEGMICHSGEISKLVAEDLHRDGKSTFIGILARGAAAYADALMAELEKPAPSAEKGGGE